MILIDTGPLVALADERDQYGERAIEELARLRHQPMWIITPVLVEAFALRRHKLFRTRFRTILNEVEAKLRATDDETTVGEVFEWLHRYADQRPDWADATLCVVCGRDPAWRLWTFDREFENVWRLPHGRPVPLAIS